VSGGVPGVGIGLHDIEFRAPVSANFIGIAVEVLSVGDYWISIYILSWHSNQVKGGVAAASSLGEVNVILEATSQPVRHIIAICLHGIDM